MKWFWPMNRGRFALLAAEGSYHAHPAEDLGRLAVDLLALLADVAEQSGRIRRFQSQVRIIHPRDQEQGAEQEPPVHARHDDQGRRGTGRPPDHGL